MLDQIISETRNTIADKTEIRELARDIRGMLRPRIPTVPDWVEDWPTTPQWMEMKNRKSRP
jgi:hypothetical protein